ncbi:hypothetical protein MHU86_21770 [Fragilaria crotonensis]|nr:hypothetical protein MHU86_21770 [Fragilaria crotonensis]
MRHTPSLQGHARKMKDNNSRMSNIIRFTVVANGLIFFVLLVGWYSSDLLGWSSPTEENTLVLAGSKDEASKSTLGAIIEGTAGGIPYLHCSPSSSATKTDLVLLHGSSFSKENWRTSGLLQKLCNHYSVTALDLSTRAGRKELKHVLDALKHDGICNIPVDIITPSASGNTIVDWLSDTPELEEYIHKWIPVASRAIAQADKDKLSEIGKWLPILAIHGDEDKSGGLLSNILGTYSHAKVVEIPGKHPCYLDSPDLFVKEVRAFL